MKKILCIGVAIMLLWSLMGVALAQNTSPIEISIYHHMSDTTARGKAMQKVIDLFNEEYAGKIKVIPSVNPDFPTYQEKVKAMIAADETPDIFCFNFNPNDLSRQRSGKLMDFTSYMDDEWKARYKESDLNMLMVDGKLYSIPRAQQAAVFYYNTELLKNAGYEEFPKTWDEFFALCEALKANGMAAISLYTADDAWYSTGFLTYAFSSFAGGAAVNSGKIDTPEMIKAAEYLKKAYAYTTSDAIGANYSVASNNFFTEKTAMTIDGPWLMGALPEEMAGKVAIAAAPSFHDGVVPENYLVTDSQTPWAAAKQSDPAKEEAVITFLKYMTSEPATKIFVLEGTEYASAKLTLSEEDIASMTPLKANYYHVYQSGMESIVNIQRNLATAANAALPSLIEDLVLGQSTAEEFVNSLNEENAY